MNDNNNNIKVGTVKVFDTLVKFSYIVGLMCSGREIHMQDVMNDELSQVPTSMFTDQGEMRAAKEKSSLKTILQVEASQKTIPKPTHFIID